MDNETSPRCSVVIATYNKADSLRRTLTSIFAQNPDYSFEVIVVNDASPDHTIEVCQQFPIRYTYLDRPGYCNAGPARNVGYRMARAPIIIDQSDEVEHRTRGSLARLVELLQPGTCVLATVENVAPDGTILGRYCGPDKRRPLFFLGAIWRADLFAVGGNDEDFLVPAGEDDWLAECLQRLPRTFVWTEDVVGWHYEHRRPRYNARVSKDLVRRKRLAAETGLHPWTARTGPWACDPGGTS